MKRFKHLHIALMRNRDRPRENGGNIFSICLPITTMQHIRECPSTSPLSYTRKGHTLIQVLPVQNAYTKSYCCFLMHEQATIGFGVSIWGRKYLNECTPFPGVRQWSWYGKLSQTDPWMILSSLNSCWSCIRITIDNRIITE